MSEFDNLESLSNADLRAKCLQHGLPNVPITDTSRKLLIKKLRALADPATKKSGSSNRRDTIAAVPKPAPAPAPKAQDDDAKRRANRRTIAANEVTQASVAAAAPPPTKVFDVKVKVPEPAPVTAPAPVTTRRRSVQREVAPPPAPAPKPVLMQTIILDDEDEEEEMDSLLAIAADTAERQNTGPHNRSRPPSALSKSDVVTTSVPSSNVRVMTPVFEKEPEPEPIRPVARNVSSYETHATSTSARSYLSTTTKPVTTSYVEPQLTSRQIHTSSTFAKEPYTSRYSSLLASSSSSAAKDFTSPSVRYSVPASSRPLAAAASPALASKFQYKEFSDEYDSGDQEEDTFKTPYLSKFARDLNTLKSQPLSPAGGLSQRRPQRSTMYETPSYRRPINAQHSAGQQDNEVATAFWALCNDLERKYRLKLLLKFILAVLVIVFIYVMVTP